MLKQDVLPSPQVDELQLTQIDVNPQSDSLFTFSAFQPSFDGTASRQGDHSSGAVPIASLRIDQMCQRHRQTYDFIRALGQGASLSKSGHVSSSPSSPRCHDDRAFNRFTFCGQTRRECIVCRYTDLVNYTYTVPILSTRSSDILAFFRGRSTNPGQPSVHDDHSATFGIKHSFQPFNPSSHRPYPPSHRPTTCSAFAPALAKI